MAAPRAHSPKLHPSLARLADADAQAQTAPDSIIQGPQSPSGEPQKEISVIIEPAPGRGPSHVVRGALRASGGELDATSRQLLRARVPVGKLKQLAEHPDVERVRPPIEPLPASGMGSFVSEAVDLTNAGTMQAWGLNGSGVKIAVVDLGFIGLTNAKNTGELPASTVAVDLPGYNDNPIEAGTSHGTGVAEQVMDMAPGATLYVIKVADEVDLQNAADYIHANGIRVTNHSVAWVNGSFYDDTGVINDIINGSHDDDGIFWAVAAGNMAQKHWRGVWSDPDSDNKLNYTESDDLLGINSGGSVAIYLNWNQYGNSVTDLDLYVRDKNGNIAGQSTNPQTGPEEPAESVKFTYQSALAPYGIEVVRDSGPTDTLDITIFSFNHTLEYQISAASLMDPACAHGAFAVTAANQAYWTLSPPPLESFSSRGPTTDGRLKPDITAPDGTTSLTYGFHGGYGTSFASPVVAGAAALLLQEDPARTPSDIANLLRGIAIDVGPVGPDYQYGYGKLFVNDTVPPRLVSAASRKTHATKPTATELDIELPLAPAAAGVETRRNGPTRLILTLSETVQAADGTFDVTEASSSTGTVAAVSADENVMTVDLTNVPDANCVTVTLHGIIDRAGNPLAGTSSVQTVALIGDVATNGNVGLADLTFTKSKFGETATADNAKFDVNLSGTVELADLSFIKSRFGQSAGCP